MSALERAILLRARPEPERFALRIPYTSGRALAAARAAFRVVEERDLGEALWLLVAGERRNLGSLVHYLDDQSAEERYPLRRRAR